MSSLQHFQCFQLGLTKIIRSTSQEDPESLFFFFNWRILYFLFIMSIQDLTSRKNNILSPPWDHVPARNLNILQLSKKRDSPILPFSYKHFSAFFLLPFSLGHVFSENELYGLPGLTKEGFSLCLHPTCNTASWFGQLPGTSGQTQCFLLQKCKERQHSMA